MWQLITVCISFAIFLIYNITALSIFGIPKSLSDTFYLYNSKNKNDTSSWWTLSPYYKGKAFIATYNGGLAAVYTHSYGINDNFAFRPAIQLKSGVKYLSGDGTKNNPYKIK